MSEPPVDNQEIEDLELRPGSAGSLLRTFVGLHLRDLGGWVAAADLVRLCGEAGCSQTGVRSALSRAKARGLLSSQVRGGAAGYALSPAAVPVLERGDRRIFGHRRMREGDGWMLVVFSVPERERHHRHRLRSRLRRLGCGVVAAGTWIGPGHLVEETLAALEEDGLRAYVTVARTADPLPPVPLAEAVRDWWDADGIDARYAAFLDTHASASGERPFVEHLGLVDDWRSLPYLDPGLPEHLTPPGWRARAAADLFAQRHARLAGPAARHVAAVVTGARRRALAGGGA